jgi:membrane-associated phospholipid phosphatase
MFFGASVLLAHVHYSIDVFAAPFIVYGVFVIAAKVFPAGLCTVCRSLMKKSRE